MAVSIGSDKPGVKKGLIFAVDPLNPKSWSGPDSNEVNNLVSFHSNLSGSIINDTSGSFGISGSFTFDGIDSYIDHGDQTTFRSLIPSQAKTLSIWFNMHTQSSNSVAPISFRWWPQAPYRGYSISITSAGLVRYTFHYNSSNVSKYYTLTLDSAISTNQWYNVVVTDKGNAEVPNVRYNNTSGENNAAITGSIEIYLNGQSAASTPYTQYVEDAFSTTTFANPTKFNLGAAQGHYTSGNTSYFDGDIGPSLLYNRELSASEVLENYNRLKGRFI
jgi:hypothetical protein